MKAFAAKYAGTCAFCRTRFEPSARIFWNGQEATHEECRERELEELRQRDLEEARFQDEARREWLAGNRIRSYLLASGEIMVEHAPSYAMACAEARALVASIVAAGGRAKLLRRKIAGKWYLGREVTIGARWSTMPYHCGWAFKAEIATENAA